MLTRGRILDLVDMVLSFNYFCSENNIHTKACININHEYTRIIITTVTDDGVNQKLYTDFKDTDYIYDPEFLKAEAHMNEIMSGKKEGDTGCGEQLP